MITSTHADRRAATTHAILDIGSAGVGAALVHMADGETPCITYTTRHTTVAADPSDMDALLRAVEGGLQAALADITHYARANGDTIVDAHCLFAALWYTGSTVTGEASFPHAKTITQEDLDALVTDSTSHIQTDGSVPLEQTILSATCNGYDIATPVGTQASTLEITLYTSRLSKRVHDSVTRILDAHLHTDMVYMHSYALGLTTAIRDLSPDAQPSFTLIDVSGEVTDVIVVRDDVLTATASFPHGSNALVRAIAERRASSHAEARSRLRTYFDHTDTEAAHTFTAATLERPAFVWRRELQTALDILAEQTVVPQTTYIAAAGLMHTWYETAAEGMIPSGMSIPLTVYPIHVGALGTYCKTQTGVRFDTFLALATHYVHAYHR